jgi:hypothetical protein
MRRGATGTSRAVSSALSPMAMPAVTDFGARHQDRRRRAERQRDAQRRDHRDDDLAGELAGEEQGEGA